MSLAQLGQWANLTTTADVPHTIRSTDASSKLMYLCEYVPYSDDATITPSGTQTTGQYVAQSVVFEEASGATFPYYLFKEARRFMATLLTM